MDTTNEMSSKFFLPAAVIVAGLLIAGAVMLNGSRPATAPDSGAAAADVKNVKTEGEPFIGNPDAPVVIAFWSDFQCPYCKAFEVGGVSQIPTPPAFPDIVKNYVDTGKVKIVFKDVVFLSPRMGMDSLTAVLYGQAVWKLYPNQYLVWREAMLVAQDEEGGGFGDAASIDKLDATIAGIDAARVAEDVKANTDAYTQKANETTAEAQKLGIQATPSFIINDKLVEGAYPFAQFQSVIDSFLK